MAIEEDPEGHEMEALGTLVPFASRRIVEIGCGDGRLTRRYAHAAESVIAIDPDTTAIAALSAELPYVDARAGSIDMFVLPRHSADVVLFSWSL
jgi:predicted RNA methylase